MPETGAVPGPEDIERVLDQVGGSGSEVFSETLELYQALAGAGPGTAAGVPLDMNTRFWRLLRWWFRKRRRHLDYLFRLTGLPHGARLLGEDTVYLVRRTPVGTEQVPLRYTAYDLIEYLVTRDIAEDPVLRRELVETVVSVIERTRVSVDGGTATVRELVERAGLDWARYREELEKRLEASVRDYLEKVAGEGGGLGGSGLARHIWLRDRALASGDTSSAWLFYLSQQIALAAVSVYAAAYVSRYQENPAMIGLRWIKDVVQEKVLEKRDLLRARHPALLYYRFVQRFGVVVEDMAMREVYALRKVRPPDVELDDMTPERARELMREVVKTARRYVEDMVAEFLPPEFVGSRETLPPPTDILRTARRRGEREERESLPA